MKTLFVLISVPRCITYGEEGVAGGILSVKHPRVCRILSNRALMPHLSRSHEVANFSANPLISHLPAEQRGGAENVPKCIAIYLMVASATFETIWDAPHLAILKG